MAVALACALILGSCSAAQSSTPPRVFGLSAQGPDSGVNAAVDTARRVGRELDVVNFFEAWAWERPLNIDTLRRIDAAGAIPAVTWEPWDPGADIASREFAPAAIAAGEYDDYITQWARGAVNYGLPMQIRFGHEMNGTWYPWAIGVGGTTASEYIAAYRHVHDLFVREGATAVQWVWSVDASADRPAGQGIATSAYPGDTYVDLVGVDGYNGGAQGAYWQQPNELFGPILSTVAEVAPDSDVWIYETGSGDANGDKGSWIRDLVTYLQGTAVTGLLWFDFAKDGEADWTLTTDPAVADAAADALSSW
ncbi:MAG: glycosyl hydrolase [Rhodococcus sp. (in: high G+C Gram-positive bacteria)]